VIWLGVGAVAWAVAWLLDARRRRYADRATTPAAALFAGLNLVKGRGWVQAPLTSHRTNTPALWWEYVLEEERRQTRTVTDSQGRSRTETTTTWHTIETRRAGVPECEVVDDTGSAIVRVEGANVVPRQVHRATFRRDKALGLVGTLLGGGNGPTGRYRETEKVVAHGDELFVVGECELDEERLVPVIARKVMISTRSEESHRRWLGAGVLAALLVAAAATAGGGAHVIRPADPLEPLVWMPGLALSLVLLTVAWAVVTYNRLRMVAQGADRAWSLIDVQLRRRHDLIPSLAKTVAAHADHEQRTQVEVTAARSAVGGSDEAEALSDQAEAQAHVLRSILARAEATPGLTADASYGRLQRELADTEDRIAASRTFYNESLTILRDRQHRFPGSLIAKRVPLTHRDLIAARGFERTVPSIEHAFADATSAGSSSMTE
jgi:hypothetical protein